MRTSCSRIRGTRAGFTLVEVVIALAIVALVVVTLLVRRVEIVRDAARVRDRRVAWVLASWKMGQLATDTQLHASTGKTDSGGFEELSDDYGDYRWEYQGAPEDVQVDPAPGSTEKPKQIFRIKLTVATRESADPLAVLEAMYPVPKPPAPAEEPPPEGGQNP